MALSLTSAIEQQVAPLQQIFDNAIFLDVVFKIQCFRHQETWLDTFYSLKHQRAHCLERVKRGTRAAIALLRRLPNSTEADGTLKAVMMLSAVLQPFFQRKNVKR